jgi:hypothetical protein
MHVVRRTVAAAGHCWLRFLGAAGGGAVAAAASVARRASTRSCSARMTPAPSGQTAGIGGGGGRTQGEASSVADRSRPAPESAMAR